MNIDEFIAYCASKAHVTQEFPFGPDNLVFKVKAKIFAIIDLNTDGLYANLKCDPERAIELREQYPDEVVPGYHMNKKHWNTVNLESKVSNKILKSWIDHSYELVVNSLPKSERFVIE